MRFAAEASNNPPVLRYLHDLKNTYSPDSRYYFRSETLVLILNVARLKMPKQYC